MQVISSVDETINGLDYNTKVIKIKHKTFTIRVGHSGPPFTPPKPNLPPLPGVNEKLDFIIDTLKLKDNFI